MEAALQTSDPGAALVPIPVCHLRALQAALHNALPLLQKTRPATTAAPASTISIDRLREMCASNTAMDTEDLVGTILDIANNMTDAPQQQQAALFDVVGEDGLELLLEITPLLPAIRDAGLTRQSMQRATTMTTTSTDPVTAHRATLLDQARAAQHQVAVAQAAIDFDGGTVGTHTLQRASDVAAAKRVEKATQKAKVAWQKAKDAGAILDAADLLQLEEASPVVNKELLPEGTRHYYDDRGLPRDAIREIEGDLERVIIPAAQKDPSKLPDRIVIEDVMDAECARVFAGTKSLNPMQSTTFETAFHFRDNLMICAPTGAGKTNVALLTVAAHFRDVGLLGHDQGRLVETGEKIVYIAPMKALAQEVVEKFSAKLKPLGLIVRELTGDMQLTRAEAAAANVIVTTPEKWDVVTRKSGSDENSLGNQCGLLIIDEVHLLADERGAVIESVVARLHRLVESRQRQVRMVALSATLPNYEDVAEFLQVPKRGIFYFGPEFRPVPLQQTFIGINVNVKNRQLKEKRMNEVCFDVVLDSLQRGYQVMVFVHSRKGTSDTATALAELASLESVLDRDFCTEGKDGTNGDAHKRYRERVSKSRNQELRTHFENGMGIHHAGMLRGDRKLTEQMFNDGAIKVLCCTATLAWGINLPAHSVIIKGTEIYNPEKGGNMDLSILDVQQIFGRAGRPQFDSSGEATMITTNEAFPRYMNKLVRPVPIESRFIKQLPDHLNAEIVGGTVSNIKEAARWLTYTYLYIRMLRNPLAYGISADQKQDDPMLSQRCLDLVSQAAKELDANQMVRANNAAGNLGAVDKGRVAAHFYIQAETIQTFNEQLQGHLNEAKLCRIICSAQEFQNMKLRPDEMDELQSLSKGCPFKIEGPGKDDKNRALITDATDKAFILLQAYISQERIRSFTLVSDTNYIASNGGRVTRALFEICLRMKLAGAATKLLRIAKTIDSRLWWFKMPLRQFGKEFKESIMQAFETKFSRSKHFGFEQTLSLLDMQAGEVGVIGKCNTDGGRKIQRFVSMLPKFKVDYTIKPITGSVLRVHIQLEADFKWESRWHGSVQIFWVWLEDGDSVHHREQFILPQRTFQEPKGFDFSIPYLGASKEQYLIRVMSDRWVGVEQLIPVPMNEIQVPNEKTPYTDLFDLAPLPTTALNSPKYEQLYTKFETFNPVSQIIFASRQSAVSQNPEQIQTQLFHVLYHTDSPVLLGAPTGSGKTAVAELAILRMKSLHPKSICVYIAPLKALARERLKEWKDRLGTPPLNWSVLELSGDTHHDKSALDRADILVCTPEKWDLISRGWRGMAGGSTRDFVKRVRLLVMDEVHLLGEDRGAVLEAIVSRTRFISRQLQDESSSGEMKVTRESTRIIGLSTMLANPVDLAAWMGVETDGHSPSSMRGLYNFRPSVRPVPTIVHVQGYTGKHYCPRMATMNRPCFAAIKELSPTKPTLIFVASRRQTRLTAFDIITCAAGDETPKMFLGCGEDYVEAMAENILDDALRHTLCFGIGLHHAGLSVRDRDVVEQMFLKGEIKVLVATATLAWGVNLPAHLVIVKGAEYFDGASHRYVDYPLTDVLQMIGRAGRPGFDTEAKAVVMVTEEMKDFYKRFLYSPFPVESCLDRRLNENLNAEIAGGTILSRDDALGYLEWTFFARRVRRNPTFYGAKSTSDEDVHEFLTTVIDRTLEELVKLGCVTVSEDSSLVGPTVLGNSAAQFYLLCVTPEQLLFGVKEASSMLMLSAKGTTASLLDHKHHRFCQDSDTDEKSIAWILYTLCSLHEFDEVPVRHNEEFLNEELSENLMWGPDTTKLLTGRPGYQGIEVFEDPHTKCFLMVQAYLEHAKLPISDYVNDTKSVIENLPRLLSALVFVASNQQELPGSLDVLTQCSRTRQVLEARTRVGENPLLQLPGVNKGVLTRLEKSCKSEVTLYEFRCMEQDKVASLLRKTMNPKRENLVEVAVETLFSYPLVRVVESSISVSEHFSKGKVHLKLAISSGKPRRKEKNSALTLTILLGTENGRFLLCQESARLSRGGSISRSLTFDLDRASKLGENVILRLLVEEIRGLDSEMCLKLPN